MAAAEEAVARVRVRLAAGEEESIPAAVVDRLLAGRARCGSGPSIAG